MTRSICLFTSPYAFAVPVLSGVAACAKRVGPWRVEIQPNVPDITDYLQSLKYDGVLAVFQERAIIDEIHQAGIPLVSAGEDHQDLPSVALDNEKIGAMGAQHLLETGCTRCAYYGTSIAWSVARHRGFAAFAARQRVAVTTNQLHNSELSWPDWVTAGDRTQIRNWLKRLELPVAVMVCSDMFARRLVDVAADAGIRVPGDLSILGVDNDELSCETGTIPLSSIDPDNERVGFEAGLLLDRLMRKEHASASTVLVPPRAVVPRQSTIIFAHKDPEIAEAMRYIHERACTDITVDAICDRIAVSRRHLERRFRQIIGHSPGEEIRHLRMERAKALLADTNMTLTEISVRCGYSHTSSFSAVFHDVVGVTPGQYRLKHGR